jgi:hypothetical protein
MVDIGDAELWKPNGDDIENINSGGVILNGGIKNITRISAYKSSNQNISDITTTQVLFETENYDALGEFASSRFTCTEAGYYEIYTHILGELLGGGHQWNLYIYKNGNRVARSRFIMPSTGAAGDNPSLDVRKTLYLEPDDYIQVHVYHENGNTREIFSGDDNTYLEIRRVP